MKVPEILYLILELHLVDISSAEEIAAGPHSSSSNIKHLAALLPLS